jgi:hypothetical protein
MARPFTGRKRGGQPGNRNAVKSGLHTAPVRARHLLARTQIAALNTAVARLKLAQRQPELITRECVD